MENQELTLEELAVINGGISRQEGEDAWDDEDEELTFKDLYTDSKKRFDIRF